MATILRSAQLRELAQNSRPTLRAWFRRLLDDGTPIRDSNGNCSHGLDYLDPAYVAMVLRDTSLTLTELGIERPKFRASEPEASIAGGNFYWDQMHRCMDYAQPDDALTIFKALATELLDQPLIECANLMQAVLSEPGWRLEAIETVPDFFLKRNSQCTPIGIKDPAKRASNSLHLLASTSSVQAPLSHDETRDLIRALKRIGVQDTPGENKGELCLHLAAEYHGPEALCAFLEAFPENMETLDRYQTRPLDYAAESPHPRSVRLLLDAGADPRALNDTYMFPLYHAVRKKRVENALVLIATGKYTEDDMHRGCWPCKDSAIKDQLWACYAAVKAGQVVSAAVTASESKLKPL